ncbi:RNA polymerase sigma factor [Alicyclobacillus mengziensis]|uniref:Uncharacterized protein n=1 Tax=Alicyclobacillus mengziensis TaxID=2931921 RepID=A0A9X7VY91_9BACL|nr:hypothetical protein [Alicyclobacillus mengziensis]QSO45953.1 hypothetical protein JZ786_15590 [Alicyclobacillus mengziensis]
MNRKQRTDDKKVRTMEQWIESYATAVLQFATLYTDSSEVAQDLTVRSFAEAYRRLDLAHVYLTDKNALFGGVVTACRGLNTKQPLPLENEKGGAQDVTHPPVESPSTTFAPGRSALSQAVSHLPLEMRVVLLLSAIAELGLSDISRILLLPRRVVSSRIELAKTALSESTDDTLKTTDVMDALCNAVEEIRAADALITRIRKVVAATVQEVRAERRHRGPRWLKYATVVTGLFSIAAVDLGMHTATSGHAPAPTTAVSSLLDTAGLPSALSGLPVFIDAQFKLSSLPDSTSLNHIVLTNTGVYLPTLDQSANSWPSIQVQYVPYADKGQDFKSAAQQLAAIDMVPPIDAQKQAQQAGSSDWKIDTWQFAVTGKWAVASVGWVSGTSLSTVTQIYLLYLPSGESNLVQTIGNASGSGPEQMAAVTAGDNRVIIQGAVQNTALVTAGKPGTGTNRPNNTGTKNTGTQNTGTKNTTTSAAHATTGSKNTGTTSLVSLPLEVYHLTGTIPLKALTKPNQIPAPFGLMKNPAVFSEGIVFRGVVGQSLNTSDANEAWYLMSWNGDLSIFVGPPADGQHHFAVIGNNSDLWWAETTPNPAKNTNARWQVLMSPLTGDSVGQPAALNLSGPVVWFGAYNNRVAWVQDTQGQLQLVVGAVK